MRTEEIEGIPGAILLFPKAREDERGFFLEIFREEVLGTSFVQANHSHSKEGVLRGLHFHRRQSDAWYVMNGEAQAMLADVRSRGQNPRVASVMLRQGEPRVLLIPPGVAHGFYAMTEVDLIYWVTHYHDGSDELGVAWDDPILACPWKTSAPVLSDRDKNNPPLNWDSIELPF